MATWAQFAAAAPELASLGFQRLEKHQLAYLATVRPEGAPCLHPVSPFIVQGRLLVATPKTSPKAYDQLRDGRYVMHMLPGANDDEFVIRGHVSVISDAETRAVIVQNGPHFVKPHDFYFEYHITAADTTFWENVGQPNTRPIRQHWQEN